MRWFLMLLIGLCAMPVQASPTGILGPPQGPGEPPAQREEPPQGETPPEAGPPPGQHDDGSTPWSLFILGAAGVLLAIRVLFVRSRGPELRP